MSWTSGSFEFSGLLPGLPLRSFVAVGVEVLPLIPRLLFLVFSMKSPLTLHTRPLSNFATARMWLHNGQRIATASDFDPPTLPLTVSA